MEQFFHNNSIFIVLVIVLVIISGIGLYVFYIDKKISKIEKHFKDSVEQNQSE
jgi:CcmD family protein